MPTKFPKYLKTKLRQKNITAENHLNILNITGVTQIENKDEKKINI